MDELIAQLEQYDAWELWKEDGVSHPHRAVGYGCSVDKAGVGGGRAEGQATKEDAAMAAIAALTALEALKK